MSVLKNLKVETKSAWAEFPGMPGFEVHVGAVSRDLSRKLRERSESTKIDPKHKVPVTKLDEEKFVAEFTKVAVLGWKGLTYEYLAQLMLIDDSGLDLKEEVPYSQEDAIILVQESQTFDNWLNEQVFSLDLFRNKSERGSAGSAEKVS